METRLKPPPWIIMLFFKNTSLIIFVSFFSFSSFAIIGGKEIVKYDDFPLSRSTVALQLKFVKDDGTIGYKKGTGILIKNDTVLTAGHNVFYQEKPEDIEIIFSERPCWGQNVCNELRISVKEKIIHPDFSNDYPNPPENDVAILKLMVKAPAEFHPIKLVFNKTLNLPLVLNGYGQSVDTYEPQPLADYRLRELTYFSSAEITLGQSTKFHLPQSYNGFCGGDSGSGLINFNNGIPEVVGIAIHHIPGKGCLSDGYFTDLAYFKNWIEQVI